MRTFTVTIRPEVSYPCPFCSTLFSKKQSLKNHLENCQAFMPDKDVKIKVKFLKPLC